MGEIISNPTAMKFFLIKFYIIGAVGFLIPYTRSVFIMLTPLALLLSFGLLVVNQQNKWRKTQIYVLVIIYFASLIIEIIGVETGVIFGSYIYGNGLGVKVLGAPLMIGLNWVLLVYCSADIIRPLKLNPVIKVMASSALMLTYDLVLEQVAPMMNMWSWADGKIPLLNYIAWFVLGVLFNGIYYKEAQKTSNPLSAPVFLIQFAFFFIIMIVSKVI